MWHIPRQAGEPDMWAAARRAHGLLSQTMSDAEVDEMADGAERHAVSVWVDVARRAHGLLAQTMTDEDADEVPAIIEPLGPARPALSQVA